MPAVPFHLHARRHEFLADMHQRAPVVMARSRRQGKTWAAIIDVESALGIFAWLAENETYADHLRAVIVGESHFFAYAVSPMWFAPAKPWLVEQFFLRVAPGEHQHAMADIDAMAQALGVRGTLMATMLAPDDEALGRLFEQGGYRKQCSQYLKEYT